MTPPSSNTSAEMHSQRTRSKSDADIDYSSQAEYFSSRSQSDLSVEDSSSSDLAAITHDGTHDNPGQSAEHYEDTSIEEATDANQAPPSEQTWFAGTLVTAENAQALFSPSACIFVANLDRTRSGIALTLAVKNTFAQIGPCWVKVRFDKKNIPAAFVQFQTDEEAVLANQELHGTPIFGRPCRIKNARAPRTVFVSRRDQADLCVAEARYYLEQFGKVEHFWTPSHTERAMYNLPAGAFLRFQLFQACQVALRALRNHETLVFTLAQTEKRQPARTSYNTILPEIVPNAIYIGDLPYNITENTLLQTFSHYGKISNVEVRKNRNKGITFAFIYFEKDAAAAMACQLPLTFVSGEHLARVEMKRTKHIRRPTQPHIYNYFGDMSGGMPFFGGGRDYTYVSGDSRYTPRSMRSNWPPY